jgi:hypothetical protein
MRVSPRYDDAATVYAASSPNWHGASTDAHLDAQKRWLSLASCQEGHKRHLIPRLS